MSAPPAGLEGQGMIYELLYTSHDGGGLRRGSGGGYCTVLSTEAIPPDLAAALEKLSGYRHPFDIHDPRARRNPTNFRHAVLRSGGATYHVLSCVGDLRQEHTGRSNKLAHHVALTPDLRPAAGPAWLLSQPGFCRRTWDGQVAAAPARPPTSLPKGEAPPRPCALWGAFAGDPGWAGVVAEHLATENRRPIYVIFPLGCDTLALAAETLALLPPAARWEATFSTYFTSLPAGTSCTLRFVLDETQEAEALRRDHREKTVDLAAPFKPPPESPFVAAARSGRQVVASGTGARAVSAFAAPPGSREGLSGDGIRFIEEEANRRLSTSSSSDSPVLAAPPPARRRDSLEGKESDRPIEGSKSPIRQGLFYGALALPFVALLGFVGVAGYFFGVGQASQQTAAQQRPVDSASPSEKLPEEVEKVEKEPPANAAGGDAAAKADNEPKESEAESIEENAAESRDVPDDDAQDGAPARGDDPSSTAPEANAVSEDPAVETPRIRLEELGLPERWPLPAPRLSGGLDVSSSKPEFDAEWPLKADPLATTLDLIGADVLQGPQGSTLRADSKARELTIQIVSQGAPELVLAKFEIASTGAGSAALRMKWAETATEPTWKSLADSLRWCLLRIRSNDQERTIRLSERIDKSIEEVDGAPLGNWFDLPLERLSLSFPQPPDPPPATRLRWKRADAGETVRKYELSYSPPLPKALDRKNAQGKDPPPRTPIVAGYALVRLERRSEATYLSFRRAVTRPQVPSESSPIVEWEGTAVPPRGVIQDYVAGLKALAVASGFRELNGLKDVPAAELERTVVDWSGPHWLFDPGEQAVAGKHALEFFGDPEAASTGDAVISFRAAEGVDVEVMKVRLSAKRAP